MRNQCSRDGGCPEMGRLVRLFHNEVVFQEAGVELSGLKTGMVHHL